MFIGVWAVPASAQNCYIDPTNLTSPSDGSTTDTRTPTLRGTLSFSPTDGTCEYIWTTVQVSTDPTFQSNLVVDTTTQGASYSIESGVLQYNTTYYWRMAHKIRDLEDQVLVEEPFWEEFSFTTPNQTILPIDIPIACNWTNITGHSPANEAILTDLTPNFEVTKAIFTPAPACDHRTTTLQIATDPQFTSLHFQAILLDNSGSFNADELPGFQALQPNSTYYWRVRLGGEVSLSDPHFGPYSDTFFFYTRAENNNQPPVEDPPVDDPPFDDPPVDDPPVQQPAGSLTALDFNASCTLDDSEFFAAVDQWITEQIGNALFFEAVDAWISQSDICLAVSSITSHIQIAHSLSSIQLSATPGSHLLDVRVYDLTGKTLFKSKASGRALNWTLAASDGSPVANGVSLVGVLAIDQNGSAIHQLRKIAIVR